VSSKKIPVSSAAQPLATNPFAALQMEGLPPGQEIPAAPAPVAKHGRVVLRREKSQRGGKTVIVVADFASHFTIPDLERFAKKAKQSCGCGGTVAGREVELQGDDVARVRKFFEAEGFRVDGVK
jgi:translation initiation factor 1